MVAESKDASNNDTFNCCDLSKNDVFDILRNERRRGIIEVLHEHGEMSIRNISEYIACMGTDGEVDNKLRRSIYISLIQTHIPKLEHLGIIEYDKHNDVIKLLHNAEKVTLHMEVVKKGDVPWSIYYLLMSGLSLAGVFAIITQNIKMIMVEYWMFVMLILLFTSSIIHYADNKGYNPFSRR